MREAGLPYAFQGEYVGWIAGVYRKRPVGVQVRAGGDGQLMGVRYERGLPGAGWNGSQRHVGEGQMRGRFAAIDGEVFRMLVLPDELWLYGSTHARVGKLRKVRRQSPTMNASPPPGAVVLFDGSPPDHLKNARVTPEGLLAEGAMTKDPVQDFFLHVEFRTPFMPSADGQARGNSGVYIQQRYEVQILDSYALEGVENECGALYKQRRPDVNMCLPPLVWQTYDIDFRAARFDADGNKIANARITLRHNGVPVHDNVEIETKTGAGRKEGPEPRPILFQNHRDPVRFRNIWFVHRNRSTTPSELPTPSLAGRLTLREDQASALLTGSRGRRLVELRN